MGLRFWRLLHSNVSLTLPRLIHIIPVASSKALDDHSEKVSSWAKKHLSKHYRLNRGEAQPGDEDDDEERPADPAPAEKQPIDPSIMTKLSKLFAEKPYFALSALGPGLGSSGYAKYMEYKATSSDLQRYFSEVTCLSPSGLTNLTAATAFAVCRVLVHQKRATVLTDNTDGILMAELVGQPTRVVRLVFEYSSRTTLASSAAAAAAAAAEDSLLEDDEANYSSSSTSSLLTSSQSSTSEAVEDSQSKIDFYRNIMYRTSSSKEAKVESSLIKVFLSALAKDVRSDMDIADYRKSAIVNEEYKKRYVENLQQRRAIKEERAKRKAERRGLTYVPKPAKAAAAKKAPAKGAKQKIADKSSDSDSPDEDAKEQEQETPDHLHPSCFAVSFSQLREHTATDTIRSTLTVSLASGAFVVRKEAKNLGVRKQKTVRREQTNMRKYGDEFGRHGRTTDSWQNRGISSLEHVLMEAFPDRWGFDRSSELVVSASKNTPPSNVPWERTIYHSSAIVPTRQRKRKYDAVTGRHTYDFEETPEEWGDKMLLWEDEQAVPPIDTRHPPAWVSRPLKGSMGNGNGGWAAIGTSGSELISDLVCDSWRLPALFPHIPNAVRFRLFTLIHVRAFVFVIARPSRILFGVPGGRAYGGAREPGPPDPEPSTRHDLHPPRLPAGHRLFPRGPGAAAGGHPSASVRPRAVPPLGPPPLVLAHPRDLSQGSAAAVRVRGLPCGRDGAG